MTSKITNILLIGEKYTLYTNYFIFFIGIIGNFLNILVFTDLKIFQKNQCILYFITESISNICQLIIFFLIYLLISIYTIDPANLILFWCKFRGMMITICTLISFSAICCSAFDQYLSTSPQFNLRKLSTIKLTEILIFTAMSISLLHSIPFCIFLEIQDSFCRIFNSIMSRYLSYFYYPILSGILPIFIASLFSILAYRNVRRIVQLQMPLVRRRLNQQLTAMVLARIIVFVFLTLPYAIQRMYIYLPNVEKTNHSRHTVDNLVERIISSFFNLNYAGSFYIFMASSWRFRRQTKNVLLKKFWRRWKRRPCNDNQIYPIG
ncbi:unnamed protein product [Rotaria sordida]|uniref:G-protein coupled receptors family 1 profile domain-containing protein n=1 Tax=Rotaria sordida TaxID=392033 RepID=A0A814AMW8_9BILA|nr:unnamed protein product [Rotaria sordida]CAF1087469.1 unnamed protein product [Rotaria sordida]